MSGRNFCAVFVCLLLVIAAATRAEPSATQPVLHHPAPPAGIDFKPDITYATIDGQPVMLDLAAPANTAAPLPCIVAIHGGGWTGGNRVDLDGATFEFAKHGYIAVTLEYRMAPAHLFPAAVQDVKAAVRYLRANADKLHIDANHIGAVGFSAGAHLAMMLGTMEKADGLDDAGDAQEQSSKVQAVVSFFGPTDLTAHYPDISKAIVKNFMGGTLQHMPDAYHKASPITYVSSATAPMLLFQGTADILVPYEQAEFMATALDKAHVPGRVELLIGANHGWGGREFERTAVETVQFFDQYLKGK
jgi:acetyl esterase/lipase